MSKLQLQNDKVVLTYDEDTKTLVSIKFIDKNAETIDLNDIEGIEKIEKIGQYGEYIHWPFIDKRKPHLILPKNATSVEPFAFRLSNIEELTWSNECHTIPNNCFENSNIKTIHNIDHVVAIEDGAFYQCERLTEFDWPSKCTTLSAECFKFCSNLSTINNIEEVESIEREAFYGCGFRTFNWPHKCKHINASCFHNSRLEEIHGIEDVEDIRYGAFSQCHNLKSFDWLPKSKTVSSWCFSSCERLYEINGLETINSIECNAFRGCGLQKIDLSESACFHIDKTAFAETNINEAISGYFAEIPQNR